MQAARPVGLHRFAADSVDSSVVASSYTAGEDG